ncbi:unnamed protein product [Paramecium primaurelia]|uniref:Uncharacterized protein n=1 Tax=Paramecium primaurelia TaxID=5886 RepID=A0A8S1MJN9_PARPR|nr:unnamed protein product [Paramecium primaurelia]
MDLRNKKSQSHHRITSYQFLKCGQFKQELPKLAMPPTPRKKNLSLDLLSEVRNYQKQKIVIESGQLTSRGLRQMLKPNKLKWVNQEVKLDSQSLLRNKLTVADFFLNSKKGKTELMPFDLIQSDSLKQFLGRLKCHIKTRQYK